MRRDANQNILLLCDVKLLMRDFHNHLRQAQIKGAGVESAGYFQTKIYPRLLLFAPVLFDQF